MISPLLRKLAHLDKQSEVLIGKHHVLTLVLSAQNIIVMEMIKNPSDKSLYANSSENDIIFKTITSWWRCFKKAEIIDSGCNLGCREFAVNVCKLNFCFVYWIEIANNLHIFWQCKHVEKICSSLMLIILLLWCLVARKHVFPCTYPSFSMQMIVCINPGCWPLCYSNNGSTIE